MPNLFNNKQKNQGTQPQDHQALTPIPESYEGDNIPYRGMENHGVKANEHFTEPVEGYQRGAATLDVYHDYEPEPEPIPVRVVGEGGGMVASRIYQIPLPADGTVTQILPRMKERQRAILQLNAQSVTLLTDRNGQVWNGLTLAASAQFTVNAQTEMFASTTNAGAVVTVYVEYNVKEEQ